MERAWKVTSSSSPFVLSLLSKEDLFRPSYKRSEARIWFRPRSEIFQPGSYFHPTRTHVLPPLLPLLPPSSPNASSATHISRPTLHIPYPSTRIPIRWSSICSFLVSILV